MTSSKVFGQKIKDARIAAKMTQKSLAEFLGLKSEVTISQYETGCRPFPVERLAKVASLLNVPKAELIDLRFQIEKEKFFNRVLET
jgi:transcriptional regulator with XRE-family HTH domain